MMASAEDRVGIASMVLDGPSEPPVDAGMHVPQVRIIGCRRDPPLLADVHPGDGDCPSTVPRNSRRTCMRSSSCVGEVDQALRSGRACRSGRAASGRARRRPLPAAGLVVGLLAGVVRRREVVALVVIARVCWRRSRRAGRSGSWGTPGGAGRTGAAGRRSTPVGVERRPGVGAVAFCWATAADGDCRPVQSNSSDGEDAAPHPRRCCQRGLRDRAG